MIQQTLPPRPFAVLFIGTDDEFVHSIRGALSETHGIHVQSVTSAAYALACLNVTRPDLIILELGPSMEELSMLDQLLDSEPSLDVIVVSRLHSAKAAFRAIQKGAIDYLTKPFAVKSLAFRINRLLENHKAAQAVAATGMLEEQQPILGKSPAIRSLLTRLHRIGPCFRTALVSGATGSGKELVARALHNASPFASGPFITCNCAAIVESLFESELFGYEKGAFTGAFCDKGGLIEQANGGTLFLDEIGELPFSTQAKLLRTLQSREIQRLGSARPLNLDFRVVAATNRDLRQMVAAGTFREDLYFRIAMMELKTPRLVDREDDIFLLANHFIKTFSDVYAVKRRRLSPRARVALQSYSWPGNVRELENAMAYCCMTCGNDQIDVRHFPERIRRALAKQQEADQPNSQMLPMDQIRKRHIVEVVASVRGNRTRAAAILGIGRNTLHRYLASSQVS